uniref:NADH-ubiquinone oxidoreductase chain 1 n=1 Tax=Polycarpa mytiligera TaxID=569436 RepID=S0DF05_POLMY|nr:NADH dehydrogenase subunit 1 [Polycarpa mytiligera]CCO25750.1 NADH dehydrogenase subunit 1 [Polycarpa mytiligera]
MFYVAIPLLVINANIVVYCLFLLLLVAFLVLLERKILGLLQERKGPNIVGLFGLVQTVMDGIKLLIKFSYTNYMSFYFLILPVLGLLLSFVHWLVIPFPFELFGGDYTIVFSFVVMGLMVYVVLGCGYVSGSSYGVIGSVRSVAQMISYEVVFMFYLLGLMFMLGSYSWKSFLDGGVLDFSLMKYLFLLIWFVLSTSELNRTPFDLVEGESELVSGYNVEYSGFGFTLLFLSEYMNIWFMGVIFYFIFGLGFTMSIMSVVLFVFLTVVIRGLLPRFKFTQLINLMWKVFLPFVFVFLLYFILLSLFV